ncbi:hypothetical protein HK100_009391, partial [Physocladia obscura]
LPASPVDAPDISVQIPDPPVDTDSQLPVPPQVDSPAAVAIIAPSSPVTINEIPLVIEVTSIQPFIADFSVEKTSVIATTTTSDSSISASLDAPESPSSLTLPSLSSPDNIINTTSTTSVTPTSIPLTTEFMHPITIDFSNLSPLVDDDPENPANGESPYNKNNKYSISELSSLNAHQQRMIDLTWADSLINEIFCTGFNLSDYKMVMAAFHNHCMLVIVTAAVPRLGIDAKRVMYYGWKEIRDWVKETIEKGGKFTLDSKLTGTVFRANPGSLEFETQDGIYSGSLKGTMEDCLIKSLTLTFLEYDEK